MLTAASCVLTVRSVGLPRVAAEVRGSILRILLAAAAAAVAVVAELAVALAVTHFAIATAPAGLYSGESVAAIAILGIAQPVLVAAFILAGKGLVRRQPTELAGRRSVNRKGVVVLGMAGMAVGCAAFAAWSLQDATTPLVVNARFIAATQSIVNVGAWWPGLFAAQVALTLLLAASWPAVDPAAGDELPRLPSPNDHLEAPASTS